VLFALVIGAVGRFTRLINGDTITEPIRDWVKARCARALYNERHHPTRGLLGFFRRRYRNGWMWLTGLISCPWCVSVWVSVPIAYVTVFFPTNRFVIGGLLACTASYVAGNVQAREPTE